MDIINYIMNRLDTIGLAIALVMAFEYLMLLKKSKRGEKESKKEKKELEKARRNYFIGVFLWIGCTLIHDFYADFKSGIMFLTIIVTCAIVVFIWRKVEKIQ